MLILLFDILYTSYLEILVLVERKTLPSQDLTIQCTAFTPKQRGRAAAVL